tara:strand:+ start:5335 stop:5901 length:567 start_codon:yes stop_codon:yes gene_type:complete
MRRDRKFNNAFSILTNLEFSSSSNALHKNKGENGLTFMGIYQVAHPDWVGWDRIIKTLLAQKGNVKEASIILMENTNLPDLVSDFYKKKYWDRARLDEILDQRIGEEIFIFGVNVGMRTAIRKAQKLIGVVADGIIGSQTISALNSYEASKFDMEFDDIEKQYYADLIEKKPSFKCFENGWKNRAEAV